MVDRRARVLQLALLAFVVSLTLLGGVSPWMDAAVQAGGLYVVGVELPCSASR